MGATWGKLSENRGGAAAPGANHWMA
jgi:hypothetical protein